MILFRALRKSYKTAFTNLDVLKEQNYNDFKRDMEMAKADFENVKIILEIR